MKSKCLKVSTALILCLAISGLNAQTMYLKESGNTIAYALSNIHKISIAYGNLTLTKKDNSSILYPLVSVDCLDFTASTSVNVDKVEREPKGFTIYPNPVISQLHIGISETNTSNANICIFSIDGKMVINQWLNGTQNLTLDLSNLNKGFYMYRYTNEAEIKSGKFIKQ